ncbi:MAG TPA: Crp/Fnr family transcriptional regulator [Chromatiaceae bacterium]|nr:Crp/Fnr family transcriptional regulator [Chromatiaceae bacterium]
MNRFTIRPEPHTKCSECPVRGLAWFEPGSQEDAGRREQLRSTQYQAPAGQILFQEGDTLRRAYTLYSGWVVRYKVLKNGQRQVLSVALPGDFIGYRADFGVPLDYSAVAVTPVVLCSFSEYNIEALMQDDPTLTRKLIQIQCQQAQECRQRLSYVGQAPAVQRFAMFLCELTSRLSQRGIDVTQAIDIPLNREDIADAIGVTSVHLSRISADLRKKQIVDCRYNRLIPKDLEALQRLAYDNE